MKRFDTPVMSVQKLSTETIITGSSCLVEVQACLDCYCVGVTCDSSYVCTSQVCPTLDDI